MWNGVVLDHIPLLIITMVKREFGESNCLGVVKFFLTGYNPKVLLKCREPSLILPRINSLFPP